jgi:diguanylate cyclase
LPNRSRFRERLDLALGPDRPAHGGISVLYLDLDGFKPINDLHGHAIGDEVLRIIAIRLTRAVRTGEVVRRLGGDEFACLVADRLEQEQLARLAGKLFDAVSVPLTVGEVRLSVTPSIGIATHLDERAEPDALLQRRLGDVPRQARAMRAQCRIAFCEEVAPSVSCA